MTVKAILQGRSGDIWSLSGDLTIREAVAMLAEKRIGAAPVVRDGRLYGIFSERDLVRGIAQEGHAYLDKRVEDVMITEVATVTLDTLALTALSVMTQRRFRHLPVVEGDSLVGFISIGDLVKYRIDRIEAEAAAMRDYISS
jgi:CBS domain-containing protein